MMPHKQSERFKVAEHYLKRSSTEQHWFSNMDIAAKDWIILSCGFCHSIEDGHFEEMR